MVTEPLSPVTVTGNVVAGLALTDDAPAPAVVDVVPPEPAPQAARTARAGAAARTASRRGMGRCMRFSEERGAGPRTGPSPVARPLPRGSRTGRRQAT